MITNSDWRAIQEFVDKRVTRGGEPFVQATVIRVNQTNKTIFCKEFGDTPIPLLSFDYQVKYMFKETTGAVTIKTTKAHSEEVEVLVPRVGDTVLIAQHFGSRRLPKCLGVIKSQHFVETGGD